ncbi:MAG: NADH/ubiquinone/plastoquinone [Phycicoccus sp.]|nr:NADH/ubiquinone/plastoquinone [Phycicoccus sp.]NMM32970.1 NADH/ubiquinone/plastoquinone [Phycicoccus sp.]
MSQAVVAVNAGVLLPVLAPAIGAAAVLVVDVVAQRLRRTHYLIALVSLVVGAVGTFAGLGMAAGGVRQTLCLPDGGQCMYAADSVASGLQLAALLAAGVTLLLSWPDDKKQSSGNTAVIVSLVLAATAGATAVAGARDLGSWLVALELATLPTVALVALRGARSAISGAIALLTTALVSFGLLALAAALWFTATGSGFLTPAAALAVIDDPTRRPILVLSVALVVAGIGFKLSLVPFHAWTPEAYDGAPLPIAAFLAGVSKIAALGALLIVIRAIAPLGAPALTTIAIVAAASMTLGNIMALRQDSVVRLLAWSTVAQAGWVVMPLAAASSAAVFASGAYLLAYVLATLLAFAVVAALVQTRGAARARDLSGYHGLVHDHPVLAAALGLALLSLAGLPPGVLGLVAKVTALRPVVASELWLLAVVAAVNAVLGVAVYLRWLRVVMATAEPETDKTAPVAALAPSAHPATLVAVGLAALALVVTSINPQLILGLLGS